MVEEIVKQDLWIEDLIYLQFAFFKRIIGSLRRQGMKEKYVSPIIILYANKWILSPKIENETYGKNHIHLDDSKSKISDVLQGIVDMLPLGEKASKGIPVGFYFSLFSHSLEHKLRIDSTEKLQQQIVSLLHFAQIGDFLLPKSKLECVSSSTELAAMRSIFSAYVSSCMGPCHTPSRHRIVAELWDIYITQIATDPELNPDVFTDLIEIVPMSSRESHDHLYRAIKSFLIAHPDISQEERGFVCKYLNCQKLSKEICIDAVQNELMPLRLIVQALFVQQLNTQQAFKECSDSFRYAQCSEFSGSLPSSWYANSKSQNLVDSPFKNGIGGGNKLGFLLQKDTAMHRSEVTKEISRLDYESSSFRIQNLEQELMSLKRALQLQSISTKRDPTQVKKSMSKKRISFGQATTCIGSVNLSSQRKYASKLLKMFRRISLFGRGKATRKPSVTGVKAKPL